MPCAATPSDPRALQEQADSLRELLAEREEENRNAEAQVGAARPGVRGSDRRQRRWPEQPARIVLCGLCSAHAHAPHLLHADPCHAPTLCPTHPPTHAPSPPQKVHKLDGQYRAAKEALDQDIAAANAQVGLRL